MFHKLSTCVALAALAAVVLPGTAAAQPRDGRHPNLHAALYELVQARRELNESKGNYGGHRKKALEAMDGAIRSVRLLLSVKGDVPVVRDRRAEFYRKYKGHPHLHQVLVDLRDARRELNDARSDFRDRRERALSDIDTAIKQVKLVIDHEKD